MVDRLLNKDTILFFFGHGVLASVRLQQSVEDLICSGYFKLFTSQQLGREEPKNYLGYE
jgi:hypothetical protein